MVLDAHDLPQARFRSAARFAAYRRDELQWLAADDQLLKENAEEEDKVLDVFLVYGDRYARLQEVWYEFLLTSDLKSLKSSLVAQNTTAVTTLLLSKLVLAFHGSDAETTAKCNAVRQNNGIPPLSASLKELAANSEQAMRLATSFSASLVNPEAPLRQREADAVSETPAVRFLRLHFETVTLFLAEQRSLLTPLAQLTLSPENMLNHYFPAMPSDHFAETRAALEPGQNLHLHACVNGHPYWIGECGRPMANGVCADCGIQICGVGHQLNANNQVVNQP